MRPNCLTSLKVLADLLNSNTCINKMESFLEANRVVEVSLCKLNSINKSGDLPLRKTLLISKVLNKAQDVATSAHLSFLRSPPSTMSSSKLLASISHEESTQESLPTGPARPTKVQLRQQSPIASAALASHEIHTSEDEEEAMDFESVSSVLSGILSDGDSAPAAVDKQSLEASASSALKTQDVDQVSKRNKLFGDITNSSTNWSNSTWQFELNTELRNRWQWDSTPSVIDSPKTPATPGKRNYQDAFPFTDKENAFSWAECVQDDTKRFKSTPPPEGCPLESLPGFCGYQPPSTTSQWEPILLTCMFGKGFSEEPSNYELYTWPKLSLEGSHELDASCENHFTPSLQTSPVKFQPILAF